MPKKIDKDPRIFYRDLSRGIIAGSVVALSWLLVDSLKEKFEVETIITLPFIAIIYYLLFYVTLSKHDTGEWFSYKLFKKYRWILILLCLILYIVVSAYYTF